MPALTRQIRTLVFRHLQIDTTLEYPDFLRRFNRWTDGPAGRMWALETGSQPSSQGAGRPFYPQAVAIPVTENIASDRHLVDQAWQQRLAAADLQFGAGPSPQKAVSLRSCDERALASLNLIAPASLGGVVLTSTWPARASDRVVTHVRVLRRLVPTFETLFSTVYELGWNDLLFETQGAFCFRGVKRPPGDPQYHSAARKLSDHGYGIALDVNVPENQLQRRTPGAAAPRGLIDPRVVALLEAFRFRWGLCFQTVSDPHHFEYCGAGC